MKSKQTKSRTRQRIQIDDLQIGTCMTVFRNRFRTAPMKGAPESDYLKGAVLEVQAINLPYVLVQATDPVHGQCHVAVDVRDHAFMPVTDEYVAAVLNGFAAKQAAQAP